MKKIIGIFTAILCIALMGIIILRLWNIEIFSLGNILKSSEALIFLVVAILILIVIYGTFLKKNNHDYDKKTGNRAHPKQ